MHGPHELKDAALAVLQKPGVARSQKAGESQLMVGEIGPFRIAYRTPLQKHPLPPAPPASPERRSLPYGLDVWAGTKVFNVQWDEDETFEVVLFKRGEWELALIAAARGE